MVRLAESVKETNKIEGKSTTEIDSPTIEQALMSPLEMPCKLFECLYYQPQPGAPVQITRSKSMAAAYLSPQIMGTLVGIALLCDTKFSEKEFRRILRDRLGIKSNYVDGEWTGVSLARWKELVECLKSMRYNAQSSETNNLEKLMTSAVWSMAVWEICHSRQCTLDYLLAVYEVSGESIWNDDNRFVQKAIQSDPQMQTAWISLEQRDDYSDRSLTSNQSYLEELLHHLHDYDHATSLDTARAIESLCTSILNRQHSKSIKPTTPNGYYGFDGGDIKPDCVEVAVRELLDYMLWDDQEGKFDSSRLPPSADPRLVAFYEAQTASERGQEWFNLMSDIPGCLYLSSSPSKLTYELTPTLQNIAKICKRILYNNGDLCRVVEENDDWETLSSLQDKWDPQDLKISFSMFSEKAKMSPDIFLHEVVLVKRAGKPNAIELRLRCDWARNTGFATVTHLRLQKEKIDGDLLDRFLILIAHKKTMESACLLVLSVFADHGILHKAPQWNLATTVLSLLASRYGVDRREMLHVAATTDLEREEVAYRQAYRESQLVSKSALLKVCNHVMDGLPDPTGKLELQLLNWILNENPDMHSSLDNLVSPPLFDYEIERALLSLPNTIKLKESFKAHASKNWAIRGHILKQALDYGSGNTSFFDAMLGLKLKDWPRFFLLTRRLQESKT
jgi:hypothetical protein